MAYGGGGRYSQIEYAYCDIDKLSNHSSLRLKYKMGYNHENRSHHQFIAGLLELYHETCSYQNIALTPHIGPK
jgi:hypothetical protein